MTTHPTAGQGRATHHPHGPDCYACTNPAAAAKQLAADRAALDADATRAREHRAAAEALTARALDNLVAGRPDAATALDARAHLHFQAANAIASGIGFSRAHLDRVQAAHPDVRERLETGQ